MAAAGGGGEPPGGCTGWRDCSCHLCRRKVSGQMGSFGVRWETKPGGLEPRPMSRGSLRLNKLVQPTISTLPKEVYTIRAETYMNGRLFRRNHPRYPNELPGDLFLRARRHYSETGGQVEYSAGSFDVWQNGHDFNPFLEGVTTERDLAEMRGIIDRWEGENGAVPRIWGMTYLNHIVGRSRQHCESARTPGWGFYLIVSFVARSQGRLNRTAEKDIGEMKRLVWKYMWTGADEPR